jgi:3-oxoadipate enol-lactonase
MGYLPSYKEAGSGPVVLFLHGLGGNRHAFDAQLDTLSKDYRCISWDTPGYGGSTPITEMTFDVLAKCVDNLLQALAVTPYAVVGHSMGGMIAQTWLRAGGQCEKLVLAQTSAQFGKPGSRWNDEFLAARLQPLDEGRTPADFARALIRSMFFDVNKQAAIEQGISTMSPLPAEVYRQVINCLITFDESVHLANIDIPTLCLAATADRTAPPKGIEQMSEAIPHAVYRCLEQAGHLAYIETPAAFSQAIKEFLA